MTSADDTRRQDPPANETSAHGPVAGRRAVRRSRMGGAWVAAVLFAVVLLLLLVFILENSQQVNIGYFGAHGHLPLGVALLLAAVLGVLLVVVPGAGRMIQLRRTARRHHKAAVAAQRSVQPANAQTDPAPQADTPQAEDPQAGASPSSQASGG
jgi:uncharacterized integral membrane protein